MKSKNKVLILLFFLSPVLGELLSGSAPPIEFFNPIGFLIIVIFYGGSTVLIRETRVRWNLQWGVLFLAIAYGILEEGVMMQSFFNFNHADLGNLAHYGEYFGIHIPWTISLVIYHATISTLIPIAIIDMIWPEYKKTALLKTKSTIIIGLSVTLVTILVMISIWEQQKMFSTPYEPNAVLLLGSFFCIILLIVVAYVFRHHQLQASSQRVLPPWSFACCGIFMMFGIIFLPYILSDNNISSTITILAQLSTLCILLGFTRYQILNQNNTPRHISSFILGTLLVFCIFFAPINEFANGATGMVLVGIIMAILLIYWRWYILHKNSES